MVKNVRFFAAVDAFAAPHMPKCLLLAPAPLLFQQFFRHHLKTASLKAKWQLLPLIAYAQSLSQPRMLYKGIYSAYYSKACASTITELAKRQRKRQNGM